MELNSFRELLLKKSADNPTLHTLISVMKDDIIADKIIEYLEKMARPHARMGAKANAGVTAFASQLKNKDVEMMRDALSHHIAHHKSALKSGNRKAADEHMNKIIPLIHLGAMSSPHSNGMMSMDYTNPQSWESNITTEERNPNGRRKEETEGWGRRPKPNSNRVYTPKNYQYFEMPPHPEHDHVSSNAHPHRGGYPFEEIQLGNPAKIDAKEAYLHAPDVEPQEGYVSHPFDFHPVHKVQDMTQSEFGKVAEDFANNMHNWHSSDHSKKWMEKQKAEHATDPEGFKARGKAKPGHHFEGMELKTLPHHTGVVPPEDMAALPDALKAKFNKPQAAAPKQEKAPAIDMAALPEALRAKFGKK